MKFYNFLNAKLVFRDAISHEKHISCQERSHTNTHMFSRKHKYAYSFHFQSFSAEDWALQIPTICHLPPHVTSSSSSSPSNQMKLSQKITLKWKTFSAKIPNQLTFELVWKSLDDFNVLAIVRDKFLLTTNYGRSREGMYEMGEDKKKSAKQQNFTTAHNKT